MLGSAHHRCLLPPRPPTCAPVLTRCTKPAWGPQSSIREKEAQEALLRDFELKRKIKSTVVPTDDGKVRQMLRQLGEPITLFGEKEVGQDDGVAPQLGVCHAMCAPSIQHGHRPQSASAASTASLSATPCPPPNLPAALALASLVMTA